MPLSRQNSLDTRERYRKFKHNSSLSKILQNNLPENGSDRSRMDHENRPQTKLLRNIVSPTDDHKKWTLDDLRADVIINPDNLKPNKGEFMKRQNTKWKPGERAAIVKRQDNLRVNGTFENPSPKVWSQGEGVKIFVLPFNGVSENIVLFYLMYNFTNLLV